MLKRSFLRIILAVLALALLAWAPWVDPEDAAARVLLSFTSAWSNVADGCGINCQSCGVKSTASAPFGKWVDLEYACGLLPADLPEYHRTARVFVSLFGTIHHLPIP